MSAMSATSTTTLKTDVTSKVLPGDKSGLPLEIWQIIFSFLSVRDLCHVARVSKTWYELALSVDMTCWKDLYLACREWRHPFWPLNVHVDPPSWKNAYRDQYLATRFWIQGTRLAQTAGCMSLLKRNRERQTIEVGPGLEHQTIKSALAVANDYDRILVHPGIYDEQLEMSLKSPFELVRSGYLQVDRCIVEDGMVYIQNPGTCHVHFSTFRHATIIMQHINTSILRNCEFSQSDNANVIVEGYPKEEKSWSYHHLCQETEAAFHQRQAVARRNLLKLTESTTSTLHSTFTGKSFTASTVKTFDTMSRGRVGSHTGEESASIVKNSDVSTRGVNSGSVYAQSVDYSHVGLNGYHGVHARGTNSADVTGHGASRANVKTRSADTQAGFERRHRHSVSGIETKETCQQCKREYSAGRGNTEGRHEHLGQQATQGVASNDANSHSGETQNHTGCISLIASLSGASQRETSSITRGEKTIDLQETICPTQTQISQYQGETVSMTEQVQDAGTLKTQDEPVSAVPSDNSGKEFRFRAASSSSQHSEKEGEGQQQQTEDHWLEISDETKEWHAQRGCANRDGHQRGTHSPGAGTWLDERDKDQSGTHSSGTGMQQGERVQNIHDEPQTQEHARAEGPSGDQLCGECCANVAASNGTGDTWAVTVAGEGYAGDGQNQFAWSQGDTPNPATTASQHCPTCNGHDTSGQPLTAGQQEIGVGGAGRASCLGFGDDNVEACVSNDGQAYMLPQNHNPPVLGHHHHHHHHHHGHHHHHHHSHHHHQHHHHHYQHHHHQYHNPDGGHGQHGPPAAVGGDGGGDGGGGDGDAGGRVSPQSFHSSRRGSSSSEDDLSILDALESGGSSSAGSNHGNNSTSSSDEDSDVEGFYHTDHMYDCSDGEESVIMLPHLRQKHLEASLSANAVSADVGSICSQTTRPITLSASQDEGVLTHVNKIRGCLIHQCRMIHSKGGVMVSLQGHALISECDISNVSYGIRCIQNARVVILKNRIHHCRTSGIFMRLAASGLIAGNDVHSNNEAGIDIRKSADPIVQHNRIHHGKRSGIVVLGSGRGQIRNNDIFANMEAGIYILYGGNPTVSENQIYDGRAAGVAVNEGGRGFIFDNTITSNQWGGVDIRRGSCPMVCRNTITNGLGDGIVIGDQGQGTIENNVISDNAGCGVWLMSASRPYIHGNQISNNGDTGVMMVNKTDIHHEGTHLLPAGADSLEHMGRSMSVVDSIDGDIPTPKPKCQHTTVQHNNIYHNEGRGVAVELGDTVDVMFNAIYANQQEGVWINQDAPVSLCGNSISSNRGCGVIIALASTMQVSGNGIYDNRDCGIHCHSYADITDNDVVGNQTGGVIVESRHVNTVAGNRIQCMSGPAVRVGAQVLECLVENNAIYDCGGGDIFDFSKQAVVRDNKVTRPKIVQEDLSSSHRLSRDSVFNKSHFLSDPPARPAIEAPPPPSTLPAHNISTVTKVMVPSGDNCQEGSKLCHIL